MNAPKDQVTRQNAGVAVHVDVFVKMKHRKVDNPPNTKPNRTQTRCKPSPGIPSVQLCSRGHLSSREPGKGSDGSLPQCPHLQSGVLTSSTSRSTQGEISQHRHRRLLKQGQRLQLSEHQSPCL